MDLALETIFTTFLVYKILESIEELFRKINIPEANIQKSRKVGFIIGLKELIFALNRCWDLKYDKNFEYCVEKGAWRDGLWGYVVGFFVPVVIPPLAFVANKCKRKIQNYFSANTANKIDYVELFKIYKLAADNGNAEAQFYLGKFYEEGLGGVEVNLLQAAKFYELAANQGYPEAQFKLGLLHLKGKVLPEDTKKGCELILESYGMRSDCKKTSETTTTRVQRKEITGSQTNPPVTYYQNVQHGTIKSASEKEPTVSIINNNSGGGTTRYKF